MKLTKSQTVVAIVSILIFLISMAVALVSGLVESLKFWSPFLNFFFSAFLGFSVLCYFIAFLRGKPFYFFLAALLLILCVIYAFIMLSVPWWAVLIVCITIAAVSALLSFIISGDNTEGIALNARKEENEKK